MPLSLLENPKAFRALNKSAWDVCWQYWYRKEYIHQGIREYLSRELDNIKETNGKLKVLDIGCGSAWCAKYYDYIYDEYVGMDFNEFLIEQLKEDFKYQKKCRFYNYDIESEEETPLLNADFDLILGNFILLELADLRKFFKLTSSLQSAGQHLILTGLDPLNEIFRVSESLEEVNDNLFKYRHSTYPVVLSKYMSFNGDATKFMYYRILYSIKDVTSIALNAGYEICEINDQLNKNADSTKAPIYFTIKMRRKC